MAAPPEIRVPITLEIQGSTLDNLRALIQSIAEAQEQVTSASQVALQMLAALTEPVKELQVQGTLCPTCKGDGLPSEGPGECPTCQGHGVVAIERTPEEPTPVPCSRLEPHATHVHWGVPASEPGEYRDEQRCPGVPEPEAVEECPECKQGKTANCTVVPR